MHGATAMSEERSFAAQRRAMVDGQIRTYSVTDPAVIAAFLDVPREIFLPESLRPLAYSDAVLRVPAGPQGGPSRIMLQPMHLARLMQGASIRPSDRVLVVGGANGYAGCLHARIAAHVVTLESDPAFAAATQTHARSLSLPNVEAATGDLGKGVEGETFDVILVQGAVETGLETLLGQLSPEGRLVAVEGRHGDSHRRAGKAVAFRRIAGDVSARPLFDAVVPVLPEFRLPAVFTF